MMKKRLVMRKEGLDMEVLVLVVKSDCREGVPWLVEKDGSQPNQPFQSEGCIRSGRVGRVGHSRM